MPMRQLSHMTSAATAMNSAATNSSMPRWETVYWLRSWSMAQTSPYGAAYHGPLNVSTLLKS
jgi:hypothetical protein